MSEYRIINKPPKKYIHRCPPKIYSGSIAFYIVYKWSSIFVPTLTPKCMRTTLIYILGNTWFCITSTHLIRWHSQNASAFPHLLWSFPLPVLYRPAPLKLLHKTSTQTHTINSRSKDRKNRRKKRHLTLLAHERVKMESLLLFFSESDKERSTVCLQSDSDKHLLNPHSHLFIRFCTQYFFPACLN